ncbi:MAG: V-type ATP synthase subunit F [Promethearchaeota archaeon]
MPEQKIYVLGKDEIVTMLGLLGIEGKVINENDDFLKEFNNLVSNPSIIMIIIALDLADDTIDFLIDFKLNIRKPFIFYLPNIFQLDDDSKDLFLTKINESIRGILT